MPFDAEKKLDQDIGSLLEKERLFCASCGHWITAGDWKVSVKEAHEHTVFNPAGVVYTIGCFRDAPGCWSTGSASSNFTWFPGYKWRLSLCEGCGKHLGWLFTGDGPLSAFYGLILNRISKDPPTDTN